MPNLRHDAALRETARAIYDEVYPSDEWAPYSFEEAERYATVQYRQAVSAAQRAKAVLAVTGVQLSLPVT